MDNSNNIHARSFADILEAFNLMQHVGEKTQVSGHTLDLVITKVDDSLIKDVKVSDPAISDHLAFHCPFLLKKPQVTRKVVCFRKLGSIDMDSFCKDIQSSHLIQQQSDNLDALVSQYHDVLRSLLDCHAPLNKRVVTIRPYATWYTLEVSAEKRKSRQCERKWCAT